MVTVKHPPVKEYKPLIREGFEYPRKLKNYFLFLDKLKYIN